MLALSPATLFSTSGGWALDQDSISHEYDQNYYFYRDHSETTNSESCFDLYNNNNITPSSEQSVKVDKGVSGELSIVKKLNHNASERDRRKKINHLYTSLRSLLPPSYHKKKLSIPATISLVLNYIPELQQKVEGLTRKKEGLNLSKSSRLDNITATDPHQNMNIEKQMKSKIQSSLSSVSARQLVDKQVAIQVSTYKGLEIPLSHVLHNLEEDGLSLLDASSFESFEGRIFHNLHLKVEEDYSVECEVLNKKLLSLYNNTDQLFS